MWYALRGLGRSPIFAAVAVLTLALGIGASAALFSIADPLAIRLLPVRAPTELVLFRTIGSPRWSDGDALVPDALGDRLRDSQSFTGVFSWLDRARGIHDRVRLRGGPGEPSGPPTSMMLVSGSFFDALGVQPALGRLISAHDDDPALAPIWLSARPVREAMTAPTLRETLARARELAGSADQSGGTSRTMARLRPGVSLQRAQAEVDVLAASVFDNLAGQYAGVAAARPRIRVEPAAMGYSTVRERFRDPVRILMAAVAFVLVMACANLAALMLVRAAARQPEIAVRLSLGSSRVAIVKLLLTESLCIAAAGGALAMLVVWWVTRAAPAYLPADFGLAAEIGIHWRVLAFTAALALLSVLLFGLGPALWTARVPLALAMRDRAGLGHRSGAVARLHRLILPMQVAVAVVLLAGAGLFVRTLEQLRAVDTGFDHGHVLLFGIDNETRSESAASLLIPPALLDRLAGLPGVESISSCDCDILQTDSAPADDPSNGDNRDMAGLLVAPRFFETMGISIVAGRTFADNDHVPSRATPAIVSASLARHLFGRPEAAVGQSIDFFVRQEIIGVANDVTQHSLREAQARTIYIPRPALATHRSSIVLRTREHPAQLALAVRAAVREFSPRLDVRDPRTFSDVRDAWTLRERALAHVSVLFGVLATLLAAIGIAGMVAYAAAQRAPEIGVRMALGARLPQVVSAVTAKLLGIVAGGVCLGVLATAFLARLVESQLFGIAPLDPLAVGGAVLIVVTSGALAAYVPAVRAARRIDPIAALKQEA